MGPARHLLFADAGLEVQVSTYAARLAQAPHRDAQSRISLTLAGASADETAAGEARLCPGDVLIKSNRVRHETRFSESGSKIFSVAFDEGAAADFANGALEGQWRVVRGLDTLRLGAALIDAARAKDGAGLRAAAADLLGAEETERRPAPRFIAALAAELETAGLKDVDIAERARRAGVHPAHLSRLFRRAYGRSLTEHAQFHAARRAIGLLGEERASLAGAAEAAGFYDQAHMNRVFRRVAGRTPGAWRRLMGAAG